MAFKIALCHYIDSSFITKVIPWDLIWIMTGTHCIDIIFQHAGYIGMHLF